MEYKMKMKRPASWWNDNWREGTPLGNGLHGALMYGATANGRVMLTHTRMWREFEKMELPEVYEVLPKMRELIFAGKVPEADSILNDALKEKGYSPSTRHPFPAADLHISLPAVKGFSHYSRELDMSTAEGNVTYNDGDEKIMRRGFVPRADDVVVIECHKDSQINLTVHQTDAIDADAIRLPENAVTKTEGEWIYFKAEISGIEHGAVARVVKSDKALVLAKIYTEGESTTKWAELKAQLEALATNYDTLFKKHIIEHKKLFDLCQFTLEDESFSKNATNEKLLDIAYDTGLTNALTERMWAYGRYLLICGTQVGGLPCNLTGLWSGEYRAFWAFNMANINLEMIYWQALSSGLTELMLPVFDYYDAAMDEMKDNARKIYGCDGIYLPAVAAPNSIKHNCLAAHITNWTAGAGWVAQHYYDYYIYTRDESFLENRALPFMQEAAKFYSDFVIWQGEKWHACPSISPENHTMNYKNDGLTTYELGQGPQSAIDAAMDIAVIKELFAHLLEIGETTNLISAEVLAGYKKMLDGALEYLTNEFGAPREWLHPDFPDNDLHRHQSHLYPMFPGLELARKDDATTQIYRQGGLRRMTVGLAHQTSWSLTQNANMMARVKDGELALESLNLIAKTTVMRNLFTTHNDWRGSGICTVFPIAPFQIDANMGWTAAVQEMLLFSDVDRIEILPALPKAWAKGSIGTMNTRCGATVQIAWDTKAKSGKATLCGEYDTSFDLYLPDESKQRVVLACGETKSFDFSM